MKKWLICGNFSNNYFSKKVFFCFIRYGKVQHLCRMYIVCDVLCNLPYVSIQNRSVLVTILCHSYIQIHRNTHTYTYKYTQTCMHIYIHAYTYIHTYTHIHAYIYSYTHIHAYIYSYIHTYVHTYKHTYIHSKIHIYIHTCNSTHMN
jgi:hypothetical protein